MNTRWGVDHDVGLNRIVCHEYPGEGGWRGDHDVGRETGCLEAYQ